MNGIEMKRIGGRLIGCVGFIALLVGLLCGCREEQVDYVEEETEVSGIQAQFADAVSEKWKDQLTATAENGEEVVVKINAEVSIPETDEVSVYEVREYENTPDNKRMFAEAFFGDEVYSCIKNREYLEAWIAEDELRLSDLEGKYESLSPEDDVYEIVEENIAELRDERSMLEDALATAGSELVKETDYTVNRFIGKLDGEYYQLSFGEEEVFASSFLGIVKKMTIYMDSCDLFEGDEAGASSGIRSLEEAVERTAGMLEKAGFSDLEVTSAELYYLTEETAEAGDPQYRYEIDLSSDTEIQFHANYGEGMLSGLHIRFLLETVSVTEGVSLLDFEEIRKILVNKISGDWEIAWENDFSITLSQMDLVYFCVKDEDKEGYYSYLPVWKLSARGGWPCIYVNAIDGNVLK